MLIEEKQDKIDQKVKAEADDWEATEIFRYQDACFEESGKEKKAGFYVTF